MVLIVLMGSSRRKKRARARERGWTLGGERRNTKDNLRRALTFVLFLLRSVSNVTQHPRFFLLLRLGIFGGGRECEMKIEDEVGERERGKRKRKGRHSIWVTDEERGAGSLASSFCYEKKGVKRRRSQLLEYSRYNKVGPEG